jgi:hypothetical protein
MPERGLMRTNGLPWRTAPAADEAAIVALFDSTAAGFDDQRPLGLTT